MQAGQIVEYRFVVILNHQLNYYTFGIIEADLSSGMDFLPTDAASEELDFYKSNVDAYPPADALGYNSSVYDTDSDVDDNNSGDEIFERIKRSVVSSKSGKDYGAGSRASVDGTDNDTSSVDGTSHDSLVYGFIPKGCYSHPIKNGALLGSEYC